ncbi:hypothetical protein GV829_08275 [Sphingomonas lacunae]|uniref:Uncharacterized protein n=1 Tax=Sphingomonas lacunae TaxID=2698828 RepID=A0A6M4AUR1_9SPHN|nr:hypothetical protein [Sphingomonas lacunae]QJQ32446.1 hypothetical protein GV829_08275 [Sphingomonas lacunae]
MASFVLSGCGADRPSGIANQLDCFPQPSRAWIARTGTASDSAAARGATGGATLKAATIYVDRSASMMGYIAGATTMDRPFQDVIGTFPASLAEMGVETRFRAFGRTVTPPVRDGAALLKPEHYACASRDDEACESHIDDVLKIVEGQRDQMAIIVTDLWFSNSSVDTSALAALQPSLREILKDRAISVYGIAAPFNGKIYDLPAGQGQLGSMPYAGTHPLYVLVIGPDADVRAFDTRLQRSGSPAIAAGVAERGSWKRAIFTAAPTNEAELAAKPLSDGSSPLFRAGSSEVFNGLAVQQFTYNPDLDRPGAAKGNSATFPTWSGPDPSLFIPHSVWQGPTQLRVRVWRRRDNQCTSRSWIELNNLAGDWPRVEPGGKVDFHLEPGLVRQTFRQEGTYVLTGEMRRLSVMQDNPQTAWMKQWSLPMVGGNYVAPSGPMFPTLNINEFGRILQDALADTTEAQSRPVTGFTVMVHSAD